MQVRQLLLDALETCSNTCYNLSMHTKEGYVHHLEDYSKISDVVEITFESCYKEFVVGMFINSYSSHVTRYSI